MTTWRTPAAFLVHLFAGLSFITSATTLCTSKPVLLTSEIIKLVDGLHTIGIDGKKIHLTKKLIKTFHEMFSGVKKAPGQVVGLYSYHGELYTVAQLAKLEKQEADDYAVRLKTLEAAGNKSGIHHLQQEHIHNQNEFATTLKLAKQDFDIKVAKFMVLAAGMKKFIFLLIEESCDKRKRNGSFLLSWAEAKEEDDRQLFHDRIRSFHQLGEFLVDLSNFLTDLIYSCPKGRAQYEEMLRIYNEQKTAAGHTT